MTDETVLVCNQVKASIEIAYGSVTDVCSRCGERVFVAPTGQAIKAEHQATILCVECFLETTPDDVKIEPLTEAQRREIVTHWRSLSKMGGRA